MNSQSILTIFVVTCLFTAGCVSSEVRESILALQKDHETYRKAVIPNPSYEEAAQSAVKGLGGDISKHLEKLEELTR